MKRESGGKKISGLVTAIRRKRTMAWDIAAFQTTYIDIGNALQQRIS